MNGVTYQIFSYQVRARALEIKIRFEDYISSSPQLDEDELDKQIDNYIRWLYDQDKRKLPKQKLTLYLNFSNAVKTLYKNFFLAKYDVSVKESLVKRIAALQPAIYHIWIAEQLLKIKK